MHLTGVDVLLLAFLLFAAVWIVIRNTLDDHEQAEICRGCMTCAAKRRQRAEERRQRRNDQALAVGRCPRCTWFLDANRHCPKCNRQW